MQILHATRKTWNSDYVDYVTKDEWEEAVKDYPTNARYDVANLAAHDWNVVIKGDYLMVVSHWSKGYYYDKDGNRYNLTDEQIDQIYPRASKEDWYTSKTVRDNDGVQRYRTNFDLIEKLELRGE